LVRISDDAYIIPYHGRDPIGTTLPDIFDSSGETKLTETSCDVTTTIIVPINIIIFVAAVYHGLVRYCPCGRIRVYP
jgi:hypothetical protein